MRPLRWKELQHALCLDPNTKAHQHDRLSLKNAVLRLCNPLLEYDTVTDELRPVHWSVCEFLARGDSAISRSPKVRASLDPHSFMLHVCLCNLRDPFVVETVNVQLDRSPFVEYTILHWYDHLLQAEPSKIPYSSLSDIVLVAPHRRAWIARYMLLQIAAFPLQTMLE
jgi:hypothetical protein